MEDEKGVPISNVIVTCEEKFEVSDSLGIVNLEKIREKNKKVGVSLNPESKIDLILDLLDQIDLVLIMSVNPGFGGQKFMPEVLEKVKIFSNLTDVQRGKILDVL